MYQSLGPMPHNHAVFDTICVVFLFIQTSPEVLRNQGLQACAVSVRGQNPRRAGAFSAVRTFLSYFGLPPAPIWEITITHRYSWANIDAHCYKQSHGDNTVTDARCLWYRFSLEGIMDESHYTAFLDRSCKWGYNIFVIMCPHS